MKNYIKVKKISKFWQIQIAISLDWKKINAFCLFYSIMHSLGLQDIIMDNVVSKIIFFEMSSCVPSPADLSNGNLRLTSAFIRERPVELLTLVNMSYMIS